MNHLTAIRHLDRADIESVLDLAKDFKGKLNGEPLPGYPRRTLGLVFFEHSTRTRVSFEQAAFYLGYKCINFSGQSSSVRKGETLKDTVLTLKHEHLEGLVVRHAASGACELVAKYFEGPVVNAGDGRHEHPTQALGDALAIIQRKGRLDGLRVAIVGDVMHSRVARSNAWLLSKMGAEVRFVGPRTLVPSQTSMLPATVYYDLRTGIEGADVVMALRLQRERMEDGLVSISEYRRLYQINKSTLRVAAPDALVMHPGPMNRGVEIDDGTADGHQSVIHDQVSNSVYVRMSVLAHVFGDVARAVAR